MLLRNKINVLQALKFKLIHVTTHLIDPRIFVILFRQPTTGVLVRARLIYKRSGGIDSVVYRPQLDISAMDTGYEVLDLAKKTFENKVMTFINSNRLQYTGRKLENG